MAVSSRKHVFISSGALAAVKDCKIITLKYTGKACRLLAFLLYSSAPKDYNSLGDPTWLVSFFRT